MAPRANSAPSKKSRRQPATGPRKKPPIVRSRQRAGSRRSARLQNKPPVPYVEAFTTCPASISQTAPTKMKRLRKDSETEAGEPEGVRPLKQPRRLTPSKYQLTEQNLRIFNGEDMGPPANIARTPSAKRSLSRHSTTGASDITRDTPRSQGSSNTTASYLYKCLAAVMVVIYADLLDEF